MKKPSKTVVNSCNKEEWSHFKERRTFSSWRQKGHFYFDKIWRDCRLMERSEAYEWLAEQMAISPEQAHFSKMNDAQCELAVYICQQLLNDNRRLDLDFGVAPVTPFYVLQHPKPTSQLLTVN